MVAFVGAYTNVVRVRRLVCRRRRCRPSGAGVAVGVRGLACGNRESHEQRRTASRRPGPSSRIIVNDRGGMSLTYVYFEEEPGQREAAKLLTGGRGAADRGEHRQASLVTVSPNWGKRKPMMRVTPTGMMRLRRGQSSFRKSRWGNS
jgi:hypothetical protein